MRRALWVVKQPGQDILHELEVISGSLSTLADAVYDRVLALQGVYPCSQAPRKMHVNRAHPGVPDVYKPQNQDQLSKAFFGLVRSAQTLRWRSGLGLY